MPIYHNHGLTDIACNKCDAGFMSNYGIVFKCTVCGQWYDPDEMKFSEESNLRKR